MLTIGDAEVEGGTVSVRGRGENGDIGSMDIHDFLHRCNEEIELKKI